MDKTIRWHHDLKGGHNDLTTQGILRRPYGGNYITNYALCVRKAHYQVFPLLYGLGLIPFCD